MKKRNKIALVIICVVIIVLVAGEFAYQLGKSFADGWNSVDCGCK